MFTKWKLREGGSFARAVVDNNLVRTIGAADDVCKNCIHFFVVMINNMDMPREVYEYYKNQN